MVAPFLLVGKRTLQDLCKLGIGWDEIISQEYEVRWQKWKAELSLLSQFAVPRCVKPVNFGTVTCRQLHHFSYASLKDYEQVSLFH